MKTFLRAAHIQARVIGALILLDLAAEAGTGTLGLMGVLIRPAILVVTLVAAGGALGIAPGGFPLTVFILSGSMPWLGFMRTFAGVPIGGSLRLLMIPQVTLLDLIVSKLLFVLITYSVIFIGLVLIFALFGMAPLPADPLGVAMGFVSAMMLGMTFGMIMTCVTRFTSIFLDLQRGVRYLGHIFSGVFLVATQTPEFILKYLRWNPLFQAVEWVRQSWWPAYQSPIADPGYIWTCIFFMLAIGLSFERSTRRWQPV